MSSRYTRTRTAAYRAVLGTFAFIPVLRPFKLIIRAADPKLSRCWLSVFVLGASNFKPFRVCFWLLASASVEIYKTSASGVLSSSRFKVGRWDLGHEVICGVGLLELR